METKENLESWLQHEDKPKDKESILGLCDVVNKPLPPPVNLLSRL